MQERDTDALNDASRVAGAFIPSHGNDRPRRCCQLGGPPPIRDELDPSSAVTPAQNVFERGFQAFAVEQSGKIDERPRRAGNRDAIAHATIALRYLTTMNDDASRRWASARGYPYVFTIVIHASDHPKASGCRVRGKGTVAGPEHNRKR